MIRAGDEDRLRILHAVSAGTGARAAHARDQLRGST